LHRYLRWRLPAYRPSSHLGGALYLFVRGMTGAATPTTGDTVHGVYSWAVPPGLVVELSDLLAGRRESADAAEPPVTTVRNRNRVAAKTSARPPRRSGRNRVPVPGQLSMLDGGAPWSIPGPVGDMGGAREGFGCPEGEPIPATPRGAAAAEERS
ncbi:MAG: hypothetical protein J2P58_00360, partial [Acidimicrobiaceae bacterium]|nr:hypothetical protein [Acidimicrobiaceae bacterium]